MPRLPRLARMSATPASRADVDARTAADVPAPVGDAEPGSEAPQADVEVVDVRDVRVHNPSDLLGTVLSAVAIALVLVLATYAHNTTSGVAEDVQGFARLLNQILFVP